MTPPFFKETNGTHDGNSRNFVGGQIEVQSQVKSYLYRGEIKALRVEGNGNAATLIVELNWMAKGEGYPPLPSRWVKHDSEPCRASLMIYRASDIDEGRISLFSSIVGELIVLYPRGGSTIKRSSVVGL